jgi:POT family proton-dependent oligopeptide transporter
MAELKQKQEELSLGATLRKELLQPFIDVWNAPRALWGINLSYVLEGLVYFGMLGYLAMHFSDFVFSGVEHADEWSHSMVAVLTAGITISMVLLGWVCDKYGVRKALLGAFVLLLAGRVLISAAPTVLGMEPAGLWSPLHLTTMAGILLVVIGYGLYQPSAYAAVRQFTTPKTAAMGFAMLYALMNLGGYIPSFAFLLRDEDYAGLGIIPGTFWIYTGITAVALVATFLILSRKTVEQAIATAKAETEKIKAEEEAGKSDEEKAKDKAAADAAAAFATEDQKLPWHTWLVMLAIVAISWWRLPPVWAIGVTYVMVAIPWVAQPYSRPIVNFVARHPLGDLKFFFFIFALIPVQTLFTYNWLVLPQYIERAFTGWIGEYFELTANLNPILIFIAVPIIAALTRKSDTYKMMIIGTFIMAAPAFLLVLGPHWWTIFPYILIMTIGEAMWQPRFLQYAAEIAPEGRTGEYMGVAQLPWFMTKLLAPLLITGWTLQRYCPADTPVEDLETGKMWLIYASIAMMSTVMLVLAKNWIGSSIQTANK